MGRSTPRKKAKRVGSKKSISRKSKNLRSSKNRRSKVISNHSIVKRSTPAKALESTNKSNEHFLTSPEVIEIEDNSLSTSNLESIETDSSKVPVSNITSDDIIDITDTTFIGNEPGKSQMVPSEIKTHNIEDDIIDITDITIDGTDYENSKTVSSYKKIPFHDDVKILSYTTCAQNNPIDFVIISDDSDEENISHQQSYKKPINFKSIKERLGIIVNTKKRAYNSPLRNRKKILEDEFIHKQETLPYKLGAFVIDKQRISHDSLNHNKFESKTTTLSQPYKSSSSTTSLTKRKLRPIIIDGLNIGHAHGVGNFSVKGIDLCVKYFADRGHKEIIAFIPQHRQGPPGSESNTILNALLKKGHICYTPSRKVQNLRMTCHDDRIILNYADKCGGVVVSNDNYRDLYAESDAFKEIIEQRQVMVTFVRDEIIVPDDQYNRRSDIRSLSDILCFPE